MVVNSKYNREQTLCVLWVLWVVVCQMKINVERTKIWNEAKVKKKIMAATGKSKRKKKKTKGRKERNTNSERERVYMCVCEAI